MNILHSLCVRCGFWWFLPWDGWEMYKILNIHVSLLSFCHLDTFTWQIVTPAELSKRATKAAHKGSFAASFWHLLCKSWETSHFYQPNIVKSTSNDLLSKNCRSLQKIFPSPLLKLRVFTFYLQSTSLTTKVDLTFSACSCPPNLFPAIQTKLWHLSSTLYHFTLRTGNCTWNYSWF